jgi:hypothetical protein
MSEQQRSLDLDDVPSVVCDQCGERIESVGQECAALDEGVCAP